MPSSSLCGNPSALGASFFSLSCLLGEPSFGLRYLVGLEGFFFFFLIDKQSNITRATEYTKSI